ncbi:hypothetical protein V6N12_069770 [Hibiscus sabdariffa]|uniref:Uncharacterized protein n=1 Tax=Hibiscus sabdariffa TaxID=183260 RepID=A0ABR2FEV9_9ROSI
MDSLKSSRALFENPSIDLVDHSRLLVAEGVITTETLIELKTKDRGVLQGWNQTVSSKPKQSQKVKKKGGQRQKIIDEVPFNMYMKAGYHVVQTDNVFILLTLQRHQHLMCNNRALKC